MVQLVYCENLDANTTHTRPFFMYNIIGATRNVLLLPEKARLQSLYRRDATAARLQAVSATSRYQRRRTGAGLGSQYKSEFVKHFVF